MKSDAVPRRIEVTKQAIDLETRGYYLTPATVSKPDMDTTMKHRTSMPEGRYGEGTYGRCRYISRYGIYGSDTYGFCNYW